MMHTIKIYIFCTQNNMLNRRAFSDIIPENVHGSRRKEEARQSEFLRIGQVRLLLDAHINIHVLTCCFYIIV